MVNLVRRKWPGVSLTGKLLPNFNLKNMILPYTKDFSLKKKDPNLPDFELLFIYFPNCQEYRRILFYFSYFHI
jgi:hypothetical protein